MSGETDRHAKAHALWEKEGRPEGRHLDHWHAAGMSEDNGVADEQSVGQAEMSAGEDPAKGSEQVIEKDIQPDQQTKAQQ